MLKELFMMLLYSVRRIFTVIVSHSTPTSGDIHHAPDNQGADEPREVYFTPDQI